MGVINCIYLGLILEYMIVFYVFRVEIIFGNVYSV